MRINKVFIIVLAYVLVSSCTNVITDKDAETTPHQYVTLTPKLQQAYSVPSVAIAVIDGTEVEVQDVYNIDDLLQTNTSSLFNIGSISKTVTALAIMDLHAKGLINIEDPVEDYLTNWSIPDSQFDSNKVTIASLLNHTSGMSMWGVSEFPISEKVPTLVEMLTNKTEGDLDIQLAHEPLTKWQYSGGGYAVLQQLIEEVTKQSFHIYMKENVLNKLGMQNSSFLLDRSTIRASTTPYDAAGQPMERLAFTATSAAGLNASLKDMISLTNFIIGTGSENLLMSRTLFESMLETKDISPNYGFGFESFEIEKNVFVGHSGQNEGWMASMLISPSTKKAIVILTNGTNGIRIIDELESIWFCDEFGISCGNDTTLPAKLEPKTIENYKGNYLSADGSSVTLNFDDSNLFWQTDYGYEFALRPSSMNTFYFVAGDTELVFEISNKGMVVGFTRIRDDDETIFKKL
jgi:CubicO group peptidase (beta-lactamase class C family)